jgi:hypothetical protein
MKRVKRIYVVLLFAFKNFAMCGLFTGAVINFGYDNLAAENYYFSSKNGHDSNNGTSSSSPWQTIEKVNQLVPKLKAGDFVYFERGSEWDNVNIDIQNIAGSNSQKIKFTSYGSGAQPRFKGSKVVTSFDQSGNIWHKNESALPVYNQSSAIRAIPFVYINGKGYDCSRYPNTGYLYTYTTGTKSNLYDATQNWGTDYWKNGMVAVRNVNWRWATRKISSNNSSTLYFDDMDRSYERENSPYLIRNHINACDLNGEWAQQNESLWIYWNGNLNSQKVEVPVIQTVFNINNSSYLVFEDLKIERAVVYGMHISGSNVAVINCTISDAGGMLIYAENHSVVSTTSSSFTGGKRGGVFYDFSHGTISKNNFKKMYFDGVDNTEFTYGACIASWRSDGRFYSEYNRMDSINLGYNMHWSNDSVWIQRNYITNFGFNLRDAAAIYFGADFTGPYDGSTKFVNNNILINAISDFVHGIYIDSNSNYVKCDSNTIANTNLAVFIHVSQNNDLTHSNIVNPAKGMTVYAWNQAIRLDEYSYWNGGEGTTVTNNKITNNTVVLGETPDETAVFTLDLSNMGSNTINNNNYIDPFATDDVLFGICQNYSAYNFYNLSQWKSTTGKDASSAYNTTNYPYSASLGIPKSKFVKLLLNPTNQVVKYDMKTLDGYYVDIKGLPTGDYVTIQPYYSVILFYKSPRVPSVSTDPPVVPDDPPVFSNNTPSINDQFFTLNDQLIQGSLVGTLIASDPDQAQELRFTISSGNENNLFTLDPLLGELRLNFTPDYNSSEQYILGVMVSDNGSPEMSANASVNVIQTGNSKTVYVDPENVNDVNQDGTMAHPFSSWSAVSWKEENTYLQKRNTVAEVDKITITAGSVSLGSYGEGELPKIHSISDNYVLTIYEKNNITISDLEIEDETATSLIYVLGSSNDNIVIERCGFKGGDNGIRIIEGKNYVIRYNRFESHAEAIYSSAQNTNLYYNVFQDNLSAINVNSNSSNAQIFNNVFYNNYEAVAVSYAEMTLYNNIFYMNNVGEKALNCKPQRIVSDHNVFYPQQDGFISMDGLTFSTLADFQNYKGNDINSINNDPQFVDAQSDNFNLKESSPAIDAGKLLSGLKEDIVGAKVPAGNGTDIGANENKSAKQISETFLQNMMVFPNPSNGIFDVSLQLVNSVDGLMDIFDINGKKIFSDVISSEQNGEFRKRVDIATVPSGIYLLKVILGSDVLSTSLVIQ